MKHVVLLYFCMLLSLISFSQNTVGVLSNTTNSLNGYTLFSPRINQTPRYTYLIDNCGEIVNQWASTFPLFSTDYLMPDGSLYRSVIDNQSTLNIPGNTGRIEHLDWDGNLIWGLTFSDTDFSFHHDYVVLANGNILMLVAYRMTEAEAIQQGRDPATIATAELYEERVLEIQPMGIDSYNLIWEWHSWDHLIQDFDNTKLNFDVIGDHPELIDINSGTNFGEADWWHSNAMSYSPELDQIIIGNRNFNEFIIIDHSTTTAEAAGQTGGNSGMGGDIIYRYGNPQSYDQGIEADRKLFGQHDVHFIPAGMPNAGKIMIFNNGLGLGFTRVQIITAPYDGLNQNYTYNGGAYGPDTIDWEYMDPVDPFNFSAGFLSGAQQLSNGNVLICNGDTGEIFEIDPGFNTVWEYQNPVGLTAILSDGDDPTQSATRMFRTLRYEPDYQAFDGRDLTPQGPIELNPAKDNCSLLSLDEFNINAMVKLYPTVTQDIVNIRTQLSDFQVELFNIQGQLIHIQRNADQLNLSNFDSGIYFVKIRAQNATHSIKIIKK